MSENLKLDTEVFRRKTAETALDKAEAIFRLLVDAVTDYAIFALDSNGNILTWNSGAERLKGYKADEIIGKHFSTFYTQHDIDIKHPDEELREALQKGKFAEEGWRVKKDGSQFWASVVINKLLDEDGQFIGFSKVTRDLTERKIHEENLHKLNASLEKRIQERTVELTKITERLELAVRARDEFLSIASHELKTPLTTLKIRTQMRKRSLLKNGMSDFDEDKIREMTNEDEAQINRLARLVDDMLDITRLSAGKLSLKLEPVNLCTLVEEVIERFKPQLNAIKCDISFSASCTQEGRWDSDRLEQVFTNLLTNAMKYGAGKPIHVVVRVTAKKALLTVQDQGLGIAKENQERIFLQFERATSANEVSGLGLGLYIVRQIVEAHGGNIQLSSQIGAGSLFTVELPV